MSRYGTPSPTAIAVKTAIISREPLDRAKAIAVPTKGAEHGVASSVANTPVQKAPITPADGLASETRFKDRGAVNSKRPKRLPEKRAIIRLIKATNIGSWNCIPHPTATPKFFRVIAPTANTQKVNKMPKEVAKKPNRIERRSLSEWLSTLVSLIAKTGRTQGIKLRIKPPKRAIAMMIRNCEPVLVLRGAERATFC